MCNNYYYFRIYTIYSFIFYEVDDISKKPGYGASVKAFGFYLSVTLLYLAVIILTGNWSVSSLFFHTLMLIPLLFISRKAFDYRDVRYGDSVFYGLILFFMLFLFSFFGLVPISISTFHLPGFYQFLVIAIFSPFCEEIFFRTYLQERFSKEIKNIYVLIFLVSFLFSIVHIPKLVILGFPLLGFLVLDFLISAVVSYQYMRTGNFFDVFLTHFVYNLLVIMTVG